MLSNVCVTYQALARYTEGLDSCQRALAAYEKAGNAAGISLALSNLGVYYETLGLYDKALASLEDGARRAEGAGSHEILAKNLRSLGEFLLNQGKPRRALPHLRRSLTLFREVEQSGHIAPTLLLVGDAEEALGQSESALVEYESALAVATELGTAIDQGRAWQKIANLVAARGETARAVDLLERAVAFCRKHDILLAHNHARDLVAHQVQALDRLFN